MIRSIMMKIMKAMIRQVGRGLAAEGMTEGGGVDDMEDRVEVGTGGRGARSDGMAWEGTGEGGLAAVRMAAVEDASWEAA